MGSTEWEVLLERKLAILPGSKDLVGGPVMIVPLPQDPSLHDLGGISATLKYLKTIPGTLCVDRGWLILVDARSCPYRLVKPSVSTIRAAISNIRHLLVIRSEGFWEKQRVDCRKSEVDSQPVIVNLTKLLRYIDLCQLPEDLQGTLKYDHLSWIRSRKLYEEFVDEAERVKRDLESLQSELRREAPCSRASTLQDLLSMNTTTYNSITNRPTAVLKLGDDVLHMFEMDEESGFKVNDSRGFSKEVCRRVRNLQNEVQLLLTSVQSSWSRLRCALDMHQEVTELESLMSDVGKWLVSGGQTLLGETRIGTALKETESLLREHEAIELKCRETYAKWARIRYRVEEALERSEGDLRALADHEATTSDLRALKEYTDILVRSFASRLDRRRTLILASVRFHRIVQQLRLRCSILFEEGRWIPDTHDISIVQKMTKELLSRKDGIEYLGHEGTIAGEKLLDLLTVAVKDLSGRDITPDYSTELNHVHKLLKDSHELYVKTMRQADIAKLRLQLASQLLTCHRDLKQAQEWLKALIEALTKNYSQVGRSVPEIRILKNEFQQFQETAAGTFEYGYECARAALLVQKSGGSPTSSNSQELLVQLEKTWKMFVSGSQEQLTRLRVAAIFFRTMEQHLTRLDNLRVAVKEMLANDPSSTPAEEVKKVLTSRDRLLREIGRNVRLGKLLKERLSEKLVPAYKQTSEHNENLSTQEAITDRINFISEKAQYLDSLMLPYTVHAKSSPIPTSPPPPSPPLPPPPPPSATQSAPELHATDKTPSGTAVKSSSCHPLQVEDYEVAGSEYWSCSESALCSSTGTWFTCPECHESRATLLVVHPDKDRVDADEIFLEKVLQQKRTSSSESRLRSRSLSPHKRRLRVKHKSRSRSEESRRTNIAFEKFSTSRENLRLKKKEAPPIHPDGVKRTKTSPSRSNSFTKEVVTSFFEFRDKVLPERSRSSSPIIYLVGDRIVSESTKSRENLHLLKTENVIASVTNSVDESSQTTMDLCQEKSTLKSTHISEEIISISSSEPASVSEFDEDFIPEDKSQVVSPDVKELNHSRRNVLVHHQGTVVPGAQKETKLPDSTHLKIPLKPEAQERENIPQSLEELKKPPIHDEDKERQSLIEEKPKENIPEALLEIKTVVTQEKDESNRERSLNTEERTTPLKHKHIPQETSSSKVLEKVTLEDIVPVERKDAFPTIEEQKTLEAETDTNLVQNRTRKVKEDIDIPVHIEDRPQIEKITPMELDKDGWMEISKETTSTKLTLHSSANEERTLTLEHVKTHQKPDYPSIKDKVYSSWKPSNKLSASTAATSFLSSSSTNLTEESIALLSDSLSRATDLLGKNELTGGPSVRQPSESERKEICGETEKNFISKKFQRECTRKENDNIKIFKNYKETDVSIAVDKSLTDELVQPHPYTDIFKSNASEKLSGMKHWPLHFYKNHGALSIEDDDNLPPPRPPLPEDAIKSIYSQMAGLDHSKNSNPKPKFYFADRFSEAQRLNEFYKDEADSPLPPRPEPPSEDELKEFEDAPPRPQLPISSDARALSPTENINISKSPDFSDADIPMAVLPQRSLLESFLARRLLPTIPEFSPSQQDSLTSSCASPHRSPSPTNLDLNHKHSDSMIQLQSPKPYCKLVLNNANTSLTSTNKEDQAVPTPFHSQSGTNDVLHESCPLDVADYATEEIAISPEIHIRSQKPVNNKLCHDDLTVTAGSKLEKPPPNIFYFGEDESADPLVELLKKSGEWLELRVVELTPGLVYLGSTLEEATTLQRSHDEVLNKLQSKQSPVEDLLNQADQLISTQKPRAEVYAAMAESLGLAWRDLNAHLETRKALLDMSVIFHTRARQYSDALDAAEKLYTDNIMPSDIEGVKELLTALQDRKRAILESSMYTLQEAQSLLDKLRGFIVEGATLDSRPQQIRTNIEFACSQIEHHLETLHDRRRFLDGLFVARKTHLEQCLVLCLLYQDLTDVVLNLKKLRDEMSNHQSLGDSQGSAEILLHENIKRENLAKEHQDNCIRHVSTAEQMVSTGHYAGIEARARSYSVLEAATALFETCSTRSALLQQSALFFKLATTALTKLDQAEVQIAGITSGEGGQRLSFVMGTVEEAIQPALTEGYAILEVTGGRGQPHNEGITKMVEQLEAGRVKLTSACASSTEEVLQRTELVNSFLEQYNSIDSWLVRIGDAFLQGHQDPGGSLSLAKDFLHLHLTLKSDMMDKCQEIDALERFLDNAENTLSPEDFSTYKNKLKSLRDHWTSIRDIIDRRISLSEKYVKFHEGAEALNDEFECLENVLKQPPSDTLNDEIEEKWKKIQEMYKALKNCGQDFIHSAQEINDPYLDVNRPILCVKSILENLGKRKLSITDLHSYFQMKISVTKELTALWKTYKENIAKMEKEIQNLENSLCPLLRGDPADPEALAASLEHRINSYVNCAKKMQADIEDMVTKAEGLAYKDDSGRERPEVVKALLHLYQNIQNKATEYQILGAMLSQWCKNIAEVHKTCDKLEGQFGIVSRDLGGVEGQIREHEAGKQAVIELLNFAKNEADSIIQKIKAQCPKDAGAKDIATMLEMLDRRRRIIDEVWTQRQNILERHMKRSQYQVDLQVISDQLRDLSDQLSRMKGHYGDSLKAAQKMKNAFNQFKQTVDMLEKRIQNFVSTAERMLLADDDSGDIKQELAELEKKWTTFHQQVGDSQKNIDLSIEFFKLVDDAEDWFKEGSQLLIGIAGESSQIKSPEEAVKLRQRIESFLTPGEEQQAERIRSISSLAILLYGNTTPQQVESVSEQNQVMLDSFKVIHKNLASLVDNLKKAEEERTKQEEDKEKLAASLAAAKAEAEAARLAALAAEEAQKVAEEMARSAPPPPPVQEVVTKQVEVVEVKAIPLPPEQIEEQIIEEVEVKKATKYVDEEPEHIPPIFITPLVGASVSEGVKFTFECRVTGYPTPELEWSKDGLSIMSNPDYKTFHEDGVCALTIEETFTEDSALFACKAVNASGIAETSATLHVKESTPVEVLSPPTFTKTLTDSTCKEGSSFQFEATVEGNPLPLVSWSKNSSCIDDAPDYVITYNNGECKLRFEELFMEDVAEYSCKATNDIGEAITSAKLTVTSSESSKMPTFLVPLSNVMARAGQKFILESRIEGTPTPILTWFHNGKLIKETPDCKITFDNGLATLVMTEAFPKNAGSYSLLAKNSAGEAQTSSNVSVKGRIPTETSDSELASDIDAEPVKPSIQLPLKDSTVVEGTTVRLDCVIVGQPEPEVIWYHDDKPVKESEDFQLLFHGDRCSLLIQEAFVEDAGVYRVVAMNSAGEASTASNLMITVPEPEPPPTVPPKFSVLLVDGHVVEGGPAKLKATVSGTPVPTIAWFRDGVPLLPDSEVKIQEEEDGSATVTIPRTNLDHTGQYEVVASNSAGTAKCTGFLSVEPRLPTPPPKEPDEPPVFKHLLEDVTVKSGEPINFEIEVVGKPNPSLEWTLNDAPITGMEYLKGQLQYQLSEPGPNRYSFRILDVIPVQAGRVCAIAENEAGRAVSACCLRVKEPTPPPEPIRPSEPVIDQRTIVSETKITKIVSTSAAETPIIQEVPVKKAFVKRLIPARFVTPVQGVIAKEGDSVRLEGIIEGQPTPSIDWSWSGGDLPPNATASSELNKVSLSIPEVSPSLAGRYTCLLDNEAGTAQCTCDLVVRKIVFPPVFSKRLQPSVLGIGDRIHLEVDVSGTPSPSVEWSKNGEPLHNQEEGPIIKAEGTRHWLVIPEASAENSGRYGVAASNEGGTAECLADVFVTNLLRPDDTGAKIIYQDVSDSVKSYSQPAVEGRVKDIRRAIEESSLNIPVESAVLSETLQEPQEEKKLPGKLKQIWPPPPSEAETEGSILKLDPISEVSKDTVTNIVGNFNAIAEIEESAAELHSPRPIKIKDKKEPAVSEESLLPEPEPEYGFIEDIVDPAQIQKAEIQEPVSNERKEAALPPEIDIPETDFSDNYLSQTSDYYPQTSPSEALEVSDNEPKNMDVSQPGMVKVKTEKHVKESSFTEVKKSFSSSEKSFVETKVYREYPQQGTIYLPEKVHHEEVVAEFIEPKQETGQVKRSDEHDQEGHPIRQKKKRESVKQIALRLEENIAPLTPDEVPGGGIRMFPTPKPQTAVVETPVEALPEHEQQAELQPKELPAFPTLQPFPFSVEETPIQERPKVPPPPKPKKFIPGAFTDSEYDSDHDLGSQKFTPKKIKFEVPQKEEKCKSTSDSEALPPSEFEKPLFLSGMRPEILKQESGKREQPQEDSPPTPKKDFRPKKKPKIVEKFLASSGESKTQELVKLGPIVAKRKASSPPPVETKKESHSDVSAEKTKHLKEKFSQEEVIDSKPVKLQMAWPPLHIEEESTASSGISHSSKTTIEESFEKKEFSSTKCEIIHQTTHTVGKTEPVPVVKPPETIFPVVTKPVQMQPQQPIMEQFSKPPTTSSMSSSSETPILQKQSVETLTQQAVVEQFSKPPATSFISSSSETSLLQKQSTGFRSVKAPIVSKKPIASSTPSIVPPPFDIGLPVQPQQSMPVVKPFSPPTVKEKMVFKEVDINIPKKLQSLSEKTKRDSWPPKVVEKPESPTWLKIRSQSMERPPVTQAPVMLDPSAEAPPAIYWSSNVTLKTSWPTLVPDERPISAVRQQETVHKQKTESSQKVQQASSPQKPAAKLPTKPRPVSMHVPKVPETPAVPSVMSNSLDNLDQFGFKPIPQPEPFPFTIEEHKSKPREKGPPPGRPKRFIPGSFTESDYESDYEGRPPSFWRPSISDSEMPEYKPIMPNLQEGRTLQRSKGSSPPPPSKFETPLASSGLLRTTISLSDTDYDSSQINVASAAPQPKATPQPAKVIKPTPIIQKVPQPTKTVKQPSTPLAAVTKQVQPQLKTQMQRQFGSAETVESRGVKSARRIFEVAPSESQQTPISQMPWKTQKVPSSPVKSVPFKAEPKPQATPPLRMQGQTISPSFIQSAEMLPTTAQNAVVPKFSPSSVSAFEKPAFLKDTSKDKTVGSVTKVRKEMEESGYTADSESTLPRRSAKVQQQTGFSSFSKKESFSSSSSFKSETKSSQNTYQSFQGSESAFNATGVGGGSGFPSFPSAPVMGQTSNFSSSESKSSQVFSTRKEEFSKTHSEEEFYESDGQPSSFHRPPKFEEFKRETRGKPEERGPYSEDTYYAMRDESDITTDKGRKKKKVETKYETHAEFMSDKKSETYQFTSTQPSPVVKKEELIPQTRKEKYEQTIPKKERMHVPEHQEKIVPRVEKREIVTREIPLKLDKDWERALQDRSILKVDKRETITREIPLRVEEDWLIKEALKPKASPEKTVVEHVIDKSMIDKKETAAREIPSTLEKERVMEGAFKPAGTTPQKAVTDNMLIRSVHTVDRKEIVTTNIPLKLEERSIEDAPKPPTTVAAQKPVKEEMIRIKHIEKEIPKPKPKKTEITLQVKPEQRNIEMRDLDLKPFPYQPESMRPKRSKGPPPPEPKKFVKGEFKESDYESDYEGKIPPTWRPTDSDTDELSYSKIKPPGVTPKLQRKAAKSPTPPSKFEIPPKRNGVLRPKIEFPESETEPELPAVSDVEVIEKEEPVIIPKEPQSLRSQPPQKLHKLEDSKPKPPTDRELPSTRPYPKAVGVESTKITKIEDSSQFHKRSVTMQQTTRVVKYSDSRKENKDMHKEERRPYFPDTPKKEEKPWPTLEPFPFTPDRQLPKRGKEPPPPRPKKFYKGDFIESDYESDFDEPIKPVWHPSCSDTEEHSYASVRPPPSFLEKLSKPKSRTPTPPSEFEKAVPLDQSLRPTFESVQKVTFRQPSEIYRPQSPSEIPGTPPEIFQLQSHPVALRPGTPPEIFQPQSHPVALRPGTPPEEGIITKKVEYVVDSVDLKTKKAPLKMKHVQTYRQEPYREVIERRETKITDKQYKEEKRTRKDKIETVKTTVTKYVPEPERTPPMIQLQQVSNLEPFPFEPDKPKQRVERGVPPPQPAKFIKGEFRESDYGSDFEEKIIPKWKPSSSDTEEHEYSEMKIKIPVKQGKPFIREGAPSPPERKAELSAGKPVKIHSTNSEFKEVFSHSGIDDKRPTPAGIEIDVDVTDVYEMRPSFQQEKSPAPVPISFDSVKDLEPFPFAPDLPKPRRDRGAPPPKPKKFQKGEFRESDYESDFEGRIPTKWRPTDSEEEVTVHRKVYAPTLVHDKRADQIKVQQPPSPPSKFDNPPQFEGPPRPSVDNIDLPRRERRESLEEYSIPKFPKMEFKPFDLEEMELPHVRKIATDTAVTKTEETFSKAAQKYAGEQFGVMTQTFRDKAQRFADELVSEVMAGRENPPETEQERVVPTVVPSYKEGDLVEPHSYHEESRASEFGTKHIDPDTGLIYFKYDFGYEFGILFPGEGKPTEKKSKAPVMNGHNGSIEIPVLHFRSDDESGHQSEGSKTLPRMKKASSSNKMPAKRPEIPKSPKTISTISQSGKKPCPKSAHPEYEQYLGKVIPEFVPTKQFQFKPIVVEASDSEIDYSCLRGSQMTKSGQTKYANDLYPVMKKATSQRDFRMTRSYEGKSVELTSPGLVNSVCAPEPSKSPIFCRPLMNAATSEGAPLTLECEVQGVPPMKVFWRKNGKPLIEESGCQTVFRNGVCTLHIPCVKSDDMGLYICTVSNAYGIGSSTASVTISGEAR